MLLHSPKRSNLRIFSFLARMPEPSQSLALVWSSCVCCTRETWGPQSRLRSVRKILSKNGRQTVCQHNTPEDCHTILSRDLSDLTCYGWVSESKKDVERTTEPLQHDHPA